MLNKKEDRHIDELDLLLIEELHQNAQKPISQLARQLERPVPTIRDRIKRLEKIGVIKGYTAIIDLARVGYPIKAIIQIKVTGVVSDSSAFLARLGKIPGVDTAYLITGDFEAVVIVNVQDVEHLRRLLYEVLPRVPGVSGTNSMLVLCESQQKNLTLNLVV